jgi:catechol 2,3-dioxygenase-like lactoylglutathione lyase family enzyme
MLRFGSVVLGVNDLPRALAFWQAALGYKPREEPDDDTWAVLVPDGGPGPQIALMLSRTPPQDHPRIHLDLYADDQAAEVERLRTLGARDVDWDGYEDDSDFVVLEDPEGNRFCVIDKS